MRRRPPAPRGNSNKLLARCKRTQLSADRPRGPGVTAGRRHMNPIGAVHGGLVCALLDSALGCAVQTTLPKGVGYTSIEIKVNYLRSIRAGSGPLTCIGVVSKAGSRVAFADATVTDASGKLVATATGSLLVFPLN
ncbi:PaaI family thioesterase [Arthrobacter sp. ISL-28]|uniref:PaaI family thioesterase n=1 Tax=Arthrobacter sp. ISL-28 TaxID=2819108 RepID=UPI001BEC6EB7|nr:PaaI family thioesterase [Arthrobacter sp. ISL-28]MBT2522476.1 PaaI family thioesterase [Arthrobacter sp. ISL-28]